MISSQKVIEFILEPDRKSCIRSLTLSNVSGFWLEDEDEYVDLDEKNDFQPSSLGFLLGALANQLSTLRLFNCSSLLADSGLWAVFQQCQALRSFTIEIILFRVSGKQLAALSSLVSLKELTIIGEEKQAQGHWHGGLEEIPNSLTHLVNLQKLVLRGHNLLTSLPSWLTDMKSLRHLDVSACTNLNISHVTVLVQLEVLILQSLNLALPSSSSDLVDNKRLFPDLRGLMSLRVLSVSQNHLTRLPETMLHLRSLQIIDFSGNKDLKIQAPLTNFLQSLPNITLLDFQGIHIEEGSTYWSDAKCMTMKNLGVASKYLKRRRNKVRLLMDKD